MHENSLRTEAMKKSLREKFRQNANFVRPLYRKVSFGKRVKPIKKMFVTVDVSDDDKPYGNGVYVKRKIFQDKSVDYDVIDVAKQNRGKRCSLPGACDGNRQKTYSYPRITSFRSVNGKDRAYVKHAVTSSNLSEVEYSKMENQNIDTSHNKTFQAKSNVLLVHKIPVSWLRVYPAPQIHEESTLSVVFRCFLCQLGLATFLILWTVIWVFIVQYFEGPHEQMVSLQFAKAQNQLVIDLATELRQITPLSPKWKFAIEQRLEDERRITIEAVDMGAKLHPGEFWDLSGTFLFNVYVMTALGFGAPVPHTTWGRTSALVYAALAVPVHIFLMVHVSTCIIFNIEKYIKRCKKTLSNNSFEGRNTQYNRESPNYSRNSAELKNKCSKTNCLRRKLSAILRLLYAGRCVPAATVAYYASGVVAFGVMRGRTPMEAAMFPLEFTTTGGLEHVEGVVRIVYGIYVEGAMTLLACALAAMRAHSTSTLHQVADRHRLFTVHNET